MKTLSAILAAFALAACGVETVGTAATGATIKKQEMDQAKKTMEAAQQKIDEATKAVQQRAEQAGAADKKD